MHRLKLSIAAALCVCGAAAAEAASYRTTIRYVAVNEETAANTPEFGDTIVLEWSTNHTTGIITERELSDLTFRVLSGATEIFVDAAIVGGVVQPLGGVARSIVTSPSFPTSDVFFEFHMDPLLAGDPTAGLGQFFNDNNFLQYYAAPGTFAGTTYDVYNYLYGTYVIGATRYVDGVAVLPESTFGEASSTITEILSADVPLPPALALLPLGLAGLGAVARRRKA